MERDLNKKEAGTWKNQLLGLGLTQPGGHRDEPDLSVVAVSLYPFPALWSCLQVCWVLPFAPERHLFFGALFFCYCRRCCGLSSLPRLSSHRRGGRFSQRYPPRHLISESVYHIHVVFSVSGLCIMQRRTERVDCTGRRLCGDEERTGWKQCWWKPTPDGRGNKRCLKDCLMDCCKLTVKALPMPCGIILPECQCFNWTLDLSLVYLNLRTHGKSDIALTYDNRFSRHTCTELQVCSEGSEFFCFFFFCRVLSLSDACSVCGQKKQKSY